MFSNVFSIDLGLPKSNLFTLTRVENMEGSNSKFDRGRGRGGGGGFESIHGGNRGGAQNAVEKYL